MRSRNLSALLMLLFPIALFGQENKSEMSEGDFKEGLSFVARMSAKKPFLKDSSDVMLEPRSLNQFFTDRIYEKLEGNAYFGYQWDEGFTCNESEAAIEEIKDLTITASAAYRLALEQSLAADGYTINPKSVCQIGIAIVGVEANETERTLPGVMIEAYLRNSSTKKSFFFRFGAGSPRGLAAAMRLSAAMLVAELEGRNGRRN